MKKIKHKFIEHKINPNTEILIIGTFNPDYPGNDANFFYGRSRNYFWRLLPNAFNESDLKGAQREEKQNFLLKYKIDLIDLISEVQVEDGQEINYKDTYLDDKVIEWWNIFSEIDRLKNLKKVGFTRKTFNGIPNIKNHIESINHYCLERGILFKALSTPARYYNQEKQTEWNKFLYTT